MASTANRQNRYPAGTDAANVPQDINNLASDLDNVANIFLGTLAGRGAASGAPGHGQGTPGSFYWATDTAELFLSFGGTWIKVTTEPGIPLGAQVPYGGVGDPADTRFLLADGRPLARVGQYAPLFAVMGTRYGIGDNNTTFNIPDKRGRTSVGQDNMGTAAGAAGRLLNTLRSIGEKHGEERHQMSINEMILHNHGGATQGSGALDHLHHSPGGQQFLTTAFTVGIAADGGPQPSWFQDGWFSTTGGADRSLDHTHVIPNQGTNNTPFNVVQPGEVDNWLVRVK